MGVIVRPLDAANFFSALENVWIAADQLQRESRQANYVLSYLQKPQVAAVCFATEDKYVDGDYLEDFSAFYVSSFPPYERYCKRLHFFDRPFTQDEFDELLIGNDTAACQALKDSYVGFLVVRPLPQAVIGRTVLRTYRDDASGRNYSTVRRYGPYLNGVSLPIRSLAFEQQDTSVAACATVALWSTFHKTHDLFGSQRPRPATITKFANVVRSRGRALPSGGLNPEQMGEAVRAVGLEPEYYGLGMATPFASLVYAYVSAGIPLILGVDIEAYGLHAVSIVGYSHPTVLSANPEPAYRGVRSRAGLHIDKLYVHDDGVGPFASSAIAPAPAGTISQTGAMPPVVLGSDWPLRPPNGARTTSWFLPEWIIVPAYPKMRVTYFAIHNWLQRLASLFEKLKAPFAHQGLDIDDTTWDIRLTLVNKLKADIREHHWSVPAAREITQEPLPRFIWRATLFVGETPALLLLFDATDTNRACPLMRTIWLDDQHRPVLDAMFNDPAFEARWRIPLTPQLYDVIKSGKATYL